jgi:hypothetical protein
VEATVGETNEGGARDAQTVEDGIEPLSHIGRTGHHLRRDALAEFARGVH